MLEAWPTSSRERGRRRSLQWLDGKQGRPLEASWQPSVWGIPDPRGWAWVAWMAALYFLPLVSPCGGPERVGKTRSVPNTVTKVA